MVDLDRRDEELHPDRRLRLVDPDPSPCADPPAICGGCHGMSDWWNLMPACPYTGWAINAQVRGPSTRFGRAGYLTANELRNRVSPTHSPQHANAPTEPTSIIAADQRRDGRHRDCPNPLRGNPR